MTFEAGETAIELTRGTLVFDGLALAYVLDEPYATRCLEAGVNVAHVTFVAEADWSATIKALEQALLKIGRSPVLVLTRNAVEMRAAVAAGRLAVMLGTQGAAMINDQFWRISLMARLGVRTLGLAYTPSNDLADGCGEPRDAGLTLLGREFVAAVNEHPLLLDLSHAGHRSRTEAAELARRPVCNHANAYRMCKNDRNVHDELIRTIVAKGGMIGACGLPRMVRESAPTVEHLADHVLYLISIAGGGAVGLGMDFNEAVKAPGDIPAASRRWRTLRPDIFGTVADFFETSHPQGIASIRELPNLTDALLRRGLDASQVRGILGENWMACIERLLG